jgi:membrane-associated protein
MSFLFKKRIVTIVFLFLVSSGFANEVEVKILNQYGAKVDNLSLIENGVSKVLTTDKDGKVKVVVPRSDSFVLVAKNCPELKMATSQLVNDATIELKKKFTWKDLINPMFYIKYGGLWMLLFIIFAETGLFAGFFLPGDSLLFVAGIYSRDLANEFLKLIGLGDVHNQWLDLLVLIGLVLLVMPLGIGLEER